MSEINGFELKLGKKSYFFNGPEPPFNSSSSAFIAANKYSTNKLLEKAGIPVPNAVVLHYEDFKVHKLEDLISGLKFPLVIKPLNNSARGKDVLCNIKTIEQLASHLVNYFTNYNQLLIEEFHGNLKSYRVLVFKRKVIGIVLRLPAAVIGDGKHTLEELIVLTNEHRDKISTFLGPIRVDEECHMRLKEIGKDLNYIPLENESVVLGYTSNATRGGTYQSLGTKICRANRKLMIKAASSLNLNFTGIDVECVDINVPIEESNGVIIEVNHCPSIRIHEFPLQGDPHFVTRKIMRSFIFRHPFAYLYTLYSRKPTAFYFRLFILTVFLILISPIFS